jgi:scavenger receptor class B protein 1
MLRLRLIGIAIGLVGIGLIIIGSYIVSWGNNKMIQTIQQQEAISSSDAASFKSWRSNVGAEAPQYKDFYLFNLTNAADFLSGKDKKPIVQEVGPYVYKVNTVNFNYSWLDNSEKIQFKTWTYYEFQPDMSTGSESDLVTNVNVVLQIMWGSLKGNPSSSGSLFDLLSQETNGYAKELFITMNVTQWLWGYDDPILSFLHSVSPSTVKSAFYAGLGTNQTSESDTDTIDFNVLYTGVGDAQMIQEYAQWQGKSNSTYWATKEANLIGGTTASQFHTQVTQEETLMMWNSVLWRRVPLECVNPKQTIYGISVLRFQESFEIYQNMFTYPPNAAFYQYGPNGVINISHAYGGMEMYMSKVTCVLRVFCSHNS